MKFKDSEGRLFNNYEEFLAEGADGCYEILPDTKKWVIVDDCTRSKAEIFTDVIPASSYEDAVSEAERVWNALSDHDKELRDAFYVGLFGVDDEGIVDFETGEQIYEF